MHGWMHNRYIYLSMFKYKYNMYAKPDSHAGSITLQKSSEVGVFLEVALTSIETPEMSRNVHRITRTVWSMKETTMNFCLIWHEVKRQTTGLSHLLTYFFFF